MKTKILITVKTYPTLSEKYEESVCTVGLNEEGKLIRIYPVPFRALPYGSQYRKYDWIEIDVKRNESDFRKESYTPVSLDAKIRVLEHVGTDMNWYERKKLVLRNVKYDMKELTLCAKDKSKYTSLAVFKPTEFVRFHPSPDSDAWNFKQKAILSQGNLFQHKGTLIKKIPFKFMYEFKDCNNKTSRMMVEDWEIGELYWNCLEKNNGDKKRAIKDVEYKFWDDLVLNKDLHFFLGTTRKHHLISKNPFMIIGLFYPKKEQPSLFN